MKITVAIPSYNKEKYIECCIKSILHEKGHIDKIILVDNCSSDKTFEIAKTFEPHIVCYRNERNLGMVGNWNKCIDLCETEWLMIFHADDEMLPGAISKYKELINKYQSVGLVHANSYSIIDENEDSKILSKTNQKEFWRAGLEAMSCHYGVCSAVMVKKEAYDKLGYFFPSLSSDAEMWARIASKYDICFLNSPTVIYRVNKLSTGYDSLINREIKDIKADWDFLSEKMANNYPTKESRDAFIKKCFKDASGNYFGVAKANIRVGHYYKALQAICIIIFTYHGFIPLMKIIIQLIQKRVALFVSKDD